ncbi:MAG TPA: AzlD domain-containing protein [Candidatus Blautia merdipullorum]|nr:AzlD domain-containing protein [Candidatus Blautia merdipullorum]
MIYGYIFVMAGVTYLIRMLPLTLIQKKITNIYIRSFLYYIPYACLTAMTFPAILYATKSPVSGAAGLLTAVILALRKKSLITVAGFACIAVFIVERILGMFPGY